VPRVTQPRPQNGIAFVVALPGELRANRTFAETVADIEIAIERAPKAISPFALPRKVMWAFLDEIEEVVVPGIRLNDPPAAGKGLGEGGDLGHQPTSARSLQSHEIVGRGSER
jgi:hypothetical protein